MSRLDLTQFHFDFEWKYVDTNFDVNVNSVLKCSVLNIHAQKMNSKAQFVHFIYLFIYFNYFKVPYCHINSHVFQTPCL